MCNGKNLQNADMSQMYAFIDKKHNYDLYFCIQTDILACGNPHGTFIW